MYLKFVFLAFLGCDAGGTFTGLLARRFALVLIMGLKRQIKYTKWERRTSWASSSPDSMTRGVGDWEAGRFLPLVLAIGGVGERELTAMSGTDIGEGDLARRRGGVRSRGLGRGTGVEGASVLRPREEAGASEGLAFDERGVLDNDAGGSTLTSS